MQWFAKKERPQPAEQRPTYQPGARVGAAVFKPADLRDLRDDLRHSVGRVVELEFVTVAGAEERCAGQNIYMEVHGSGSVLHGAWVVDEDVEFIDSPRPGVGFTQPISPPDVRQPSRVSPLEPPLVLFVDDSRDTRDLYGLILTHAGYQVINADDGLRALEVARRARPDAIVMDINLPQLNGVETIKLLRAEPTTSNTPILVFTAHGAASAAEAVRIGANAQCLKPCLPDAFLDSLRSILPASVDSIGAR